VVTLKKQTGIWVDSAVWEEYRQLCSREKLRPAEPIEKFVRFIVSGGSAKAVFPMLDASQRQESFDAYARVLLDWLRKDIGYVSMPGENGAPVESMLLQTLKHVTNRNLRSEIEEALKKAQDKIETEESGMAEDIDSEDTDDEREKAEDSEERDSENMKPEDMSVDELQEKINQLKRIKGLIKNAK
jgi:hypothetical protein